VDYLILVFGCVFAVVGGERFVRGSVGFAERLRVPPGLIGATVAAFATSSPELTVGALSATEGRPELAYGDVIGSNMVNLGVVLGITLTLNSILVTRREVMREFIGCVASLILLLLFTLDGSISRVECSLLLLGFVMWLSMVVHNGLKRRTISDEPIVAQSVNQSQVLLDGVVGIASLVIAGRLIVVAAKGLGESLGWSQFVVGSVLVAVGTSAPELATAFIAVRRGHYGVGVGTVLGSNIFNSLMIVGVAGLISPIPADTRLSGAVLGISLLATFIVLPRADGLLGRHRGLVLIGSYAVFLVIVGT
jgi:cation:H+ antiporter